MNTILVFDGRKFKNLVIYSFPLSKSELNMVLMSLLGLYFQIESRCDAKI